MSSIYKSRLSLSIFGQSHGAAIGMTLDGVPAGEEIDMNALRVFLKRRARGRFSWATPRAEADEPEFLSGVVGGRTCGAPITAIIRNTNVRPGDYSNVQAVPRPGHADFTARAKHGEYADLSGGGHSSGRLTVALCVAGGICHQLLRRRGVFIGAHIAAIGSVRDDLLDPVTADEFLLHKLRGLDIPVINSKITPLIIEEIERAKQANDSVGGVIECAAVGLPAGLGAPIFDGMENRIARLVFAIPAVVGIEFGAGFSAAATLGSENNDAFVVTGGEVKTATNRHGGILGGITSGMPLIFRAAVKPTPSISQPQQSVNLHTLQPATLEVKGRHDPCIVPRAVPCFEAAAAVALLDAFLENR